MSTTPYIELHGTFYQTFLARLHEDLKPATYLEIGTLNGDTLKLSQCASISIDPKFQISDNVMTGKPACHFFQVGSDDFFEQNDCHHILGAKLDMAFLDGMHLFEYLLRDFYNTEMKCHENSVIIMHDCIPGDSHIAVRDPSDKRRQRSVYPGYWTGDVWKIIPILKKWRPDLILEVVDAPPTGLVIVTGLNPSNRVLQTNYQSIVEEYISIDLEDYGVSCLHRLANIVSTEVFESKRNIQVYDNSVSLAPKKHSDGHLISFRYISPVEIARSSVRDVSMRVSLDSGSAVQHRARSAASFHDDPDSAGLFPELPEGPVPHSPQFVVTAEKADLTGYRTILSRNGTFFNDEALLSDQELTAYLTRLAIQEDFPNENTGLRSTSSAKIFQFDRKNRIIERLEGKTVSLCSFEPTNYGSFLFRVLPKLASRPQILEGAKILCPLYSQSMADLLEIAGLEREKIIPHDPNRIYACDEVTIPSVRNPHALLDEESLGFYRDIREQFGSKERGRKLYVSRLGWGGSKEAQTRVMLNESELVRRMATEGFDVVRPQDLSAKKQIEVFSSADIVVGPAGSGMFNVVFCHPGTKIVDIESEPHWIFAHCNLFGSCGMDYGVFEAKAIDADWSRSHKNFNVNLDALMERISSL